MRHAPADELDVHPVEGGHCGRGRFVADAPVIDEARATALQGNHVEAPRRCEVLHSGEAEGVGTRGLGWVLRVDPLDQVFAWDDIGPFHGHSVEVEGCDVAGHHGIGLLEFFLDLVGVEEGESGKDALEEFGGE